MSVPTIKDLLVQIEQRLEDIHVLEGPASFPASVDPLSEIGKFITIDRLLADLYKQYLEAQKKYIKAIDTYGLEAPITETASFMADSTFSALETRLIELREDESTQRKVDALNRLQNLNIHLCETEYDIDLNHTADEEDMFDVQNDITVAASMDFAHVAA